MSDATSRTLIIGAAVGYTEAQIEPFLRSLARTDYSGDVALLVDQRLHDRLRRSVLGRDVDLVVVPQWWPFRLRLHKGRRRKFFFLWQPVRGVMWLLLRLFDAIPLTQQRKRGLQLAIGSILHPPHQTRFFHYLRYLARQPYSHVLITDVRDVIFQGNPSRQLPSKGLSVSIEPRRYTLATSPNNAKWIRLAFGGKVLDEIGGKPVSCSGTTYGDRMSMLRYLEQMTDAILGMRFGGTDRPLDQAPHNVLLWTGQLGACNLLETYASPIATLGDYREGDLRFGPSGQITNPDGSSICILHMYDRWPQVKAHLASFV